MASGFFRRAKSRFRALTSHKNEQKSFGEVVASGGKRWQRVANGGRVGGMGGAARLRQKLTEFDKFDKQFNTPCSPSGAAESLRAFRRTDSEGLWVGDLVLW